MTKQVYTSKNFNNQSINNAQGFSGNQVFEVADLTARDAITTQAIADIAKVADDGTGNPRDYIWNGSSWLAFIGSSSGGSGGSGGSGNSSAEVIDTFTDADGTAITAHTADTNTTGNNYQEITTSGATLIANSSTIQNNSLQIAEDNHGFGIDLVSTDATIGFTWIPQVGQLNRNSLVLRWVDNQNQILVNIREDNGDVGILQVVGGVTISEYRANITFTEGNIYCFTALLNGDYIVATISEATAGTATGNHQSVTAVVLDPVLKTGTVFGAVRNVGSISTIIDNFSLKSLGGGSSSSLPANVRELLTADRTYFVATTGDDNNDGLSSGSPFLTVQKAIDTIAGLDWAGIYQPTIQLADGTYSYATDIILKSVVGADRIVIQGNSTTPANVTIEITSSDTFAFRAINISSTYSIENLKIVLNQATTGSLTSGALKVVSSYQEVNNLVLEGVNVQSNPIQWFRSEDNGVIYIPSTGNIEFLPYTTGTPTQYIGFVTVGAITRMNGVNFTLTSTPNFTVFLSAMRVASVFVSGFTTSGTATGQKFEAVNIANVLTGGNSANLPGDVAGVVDTASFGHVE